MSTKTVGRPAAIPAGLPQALKPGDEAVGLFEGVPYEQYWEDPGRSRQETLENHLLARSLPRSGDTIVDLGCGYGRLAPLYLGKFRKTVLVDGSLSLLRQARERYGDAVTLVAADVRRLPFRAGSFDCAVSVRVLQHLQDPSSAIAEAHRVLGGGGTYIASFHNKRNLRRVMHYFAGKDVARPFGPDSVEVSPALISHHPRTFDAWMRGAGFGSISYEGAMVVEPVARVTERIGGGAPSGTRWARLSGAMAVAPWLIGKATATESHQGGQPKPRESRPAEYPEDLLCCPECQGGLRVEGHSMACPACERNYPIIDGIFDLRP